MATRLNLNRSQLSQFLKDQEQIRQFERLFTTVNEITDETVIELQISSDNAANKAVEALTEIQKPSVDYIDFNESAPVYDKTRRMHWGDDDKTLSVGMEYGVVQQVGMETYALVENSTGSTIPNGSVVGFTGVGSNNTLSVAPYLADGSTPTLYILGIMTHALPNSGQVGYCTVWGHVSGVDTSAFSLGDILYASPTVAGELTNVKPTAPDNVIPIAAVLSVGVTDGEIFVRPTIEQQKYYGEFTNTTGATPAANNTAYALAWDNIEVAGGVTISGTPTTQVTVPVSGLYQFDARIQLLSSSGNIKSAWLWYRLNGTTNYANSSVIGTLASNGGYLVLRNAEIFSLNAGDYLEIMWAVNDTTLAPANVAATAFAPAAPCGLLSVTQVQQ
jgi:hypothetical protein